MLCKIIHIRRDFRNSSSATSSSKKSAQVFTISCEKALKMEAAHCFILKRILNSNAHLIFFFLPSAGGKSFYLAGNKTNSIFSLS